MMQFCQFNQNVKTAKMFCESTHDHYKYWTISPNDKEYDHDEEYERLLEKLITQMTITIGGVIKKAVDYAKSGDVSLQIKGSYVQLRIEKLDVESIEVCLPIQFELAMQPS